MGWRRGRDFILLGARHTQCSLSSEAPKLGAVLLVSFVKPTSAAGDSVPAMAHGWL
jgi:hypothetical protein